MNPKTQPTDLAAQAERRERVEEAMTILDRLRHRHWRVWYRARDYCRCFVWRYRSDTLPQYPPATYLLNYRFKVEEGRLWWCRPAWVKRRLLLRW